MVMSSLCSDATLLKYFSHCHVKLANLCYCHVNLVLCFNLSSNITLCIAADLIISRVLSQLLMQLIFEPLQTQNAFNLCPHLHYPTILLNQFFGILFSALPKFSTVCSSFVFIW